MGKDFQVGFLVNLVKPVSICHKLKQVTRIVLHTNLHGVVCKFSF